jgi:predicted nucleotidyltransferase
VKRNKKHITLETIIDELKKIKPEISEKFYVKEIGIFGSYVRGEEKASSDIDILVEFSKPIGLFKFMDLEDYLRRRLKIKVDLVSKKALKPYIGEKILKETKFI